MKCPFCSKEMKFGTINARGGGGMYWLPEGEKLKVLETVSDASISKHNGVSLVDLDTVGTVRCDAFICSECKKIVIDYK